jgi:hypothetical protein
MLFTFLFYYIYGIPILSDNIEIARVEFQKLPFAFFFYRINQIAMPFLSIILLSFAYIYNKKEYYILFIVIFTINVVILFTLGFKGYILWYIILILMTINLYKRGSEIRKVSVILILIALIAVVISTENIYHFNNYSRIFSKVIQRFTITNAGGYCILMNEMIPAEGEKNLNESLNSYLWKWKFGSNTKKAEVDMRLTITITGSLIYYTGFYGFIILTFIFGYLIHYLNILCFKYLNEPVILTTIVYFIYSFLGVINRGLSIYFFTFTLSSLIFMFFSYLSLYVLLNHNPTIRVKRIKKSLIL